LDRHPAVHLLHDHLAFAQMVYFFCVQAPFTGGEDGIQSIQR
jgi:branched-chain amino acid transport system permease protein